MRLAPDIWELNPESLDFRAAKRAADAKGWLRPWAIVAFNMLLAAALDAWAFFGRAMPGVSTRQILSQLREEGTPPVSNILWGYIVRAGDAFPGIPVTAWMAGVSMACGVLCVGILTAMMLHRGYWVVEKSSPDAVRRESWARRLAALSAGIFLAVSAPFWVASTRSFPMTFHLLMVLGWAVLHEAYKKTGRRAFLGLSLFTWGVLATQTDTGWFMAPVVLWMAMREMVHWSHHKSWLAWLVYVFSAAAGLSLYAVMAWLVVRRGAWVGMYAGGMAEAFPAIFRAQFAGLLAMHFSPALLVFGCVLGIPWLVLFVMSHRCPWCYESAEIGIRVLFGIGLATIAWTPPYAPCFLVVGGLVDPPVVPSLILAVCFGCVVGETWIMGDLRPRIDNTGPKRFLRRSMAVLALLLVPAAAGAGVWNAGLVKIPGGLWTFDAMRDLFAQRGDRDVMLCGAPFDDLTIMEMREERMPWIVMSYSRARTPQYLKLLAMRFPKGAEEGFFFSQGNFDAGMRTWLDREEGLKRTMVLGRPDLYLEYGWMAPVGIAYRIELSPDDIPLDGVLASQRPFWEKVADAAGLEWRPLNPYLPFWRQCNAIVARQANDAGVRAAGEGRLELADELFALADRISPSNLSVKMNRYRVGQRLGLPEEELAARREAYENETWASVQARWVLAAYLGYVWDPDGWMRDGVVWALSGAPLNEPGARRKSALDRAVDGRFERWLNQAYLVAGREDLPENVYRQKMMDNPWGVEPLLELARLALRDKHPDIAEAYLHEAVEHGLKTASIPFEWAMTDFVRLRFAGWEGRKDRDFPAGKTLDALELQSPLHDPGLWLDRDGRVRPAAEVFTQLAEATPADMRIWMTLYLLADGAEPESDRIEKILKTQRPNDADLWLSLCDLHIKREEWEKARDELNRALSLDAERIALWEMSMSIAEHYGNVKLLLSAKNRLLRMQPFHFLAQQQQGQELYVRGDLEGAAKVFEQGIFFKRDPVLLNNLAHVLTDLDADGNYRDAILLVDEAIKRDPDRLGFYATRANIHLRHGETRRALDDIRLATGGKSPGIPELLLLAEICRAMDDAPHAESALKRIAEKKTRPRFDEQQRIYAVRDWLDHRRAAEDGAEGGGK